MKRPNPHTLPTDFQSKEKEALVRRHRLVVHLNDREWEALKRYQQSLKGKTQSAICREAINEAVLKGLSENQPTLF